jgi:hypothetical protein
VNIDVMIETCWSSRHCHAWNWKVAMQLTLFQTSAKLQEELAVHRFMAYSLLTLGVFQIPKVKYYRDIECMAL